MGKPEGRVEDHLKDLVEAAGGACWKFSASIRNGVPDRIVILPQCGTVFVETKAPGGRLRTLQEVRHEQMRAAGATVHVASTRAEVEDLVARLTDTSKEKP